MLRWFTSYAGDDWDPSKGYTPAFVREVYAIRDRFGLVRGMVGEYEGTGVLVPHDVPYPPESSPNNPSRTIQVDVVVDSLKYDEVRPTAYAIGITANVPQLRLTLRVYAPGGDQIVRASFFIIFPNGYPMQKPHIRLVREGAFANKTPGYLRGHDLLCVLNRDQDWRPQEHNVLRMVDTIVTWVVANWQLNRL